MNLTRKRKNVVKSMVYKGRLIVHGSKLLSGMSVASACAWKINFEMTGGRVEKIGSLKNTLTGKRIALWSVILTILVAAILIVEPPRAYATLTLQLSDGSSNVTISDNGVGDLNPTVGAVTFLGSVGIWSLNLSTALSYPVLGTPALPKLHVDSVNVSSAGAGSLSIWATQTGYSGPFSGNFLLGTGGWTDGTVDVQALINGTPLGGLGPFTGAFSGTKGGSVATGGPYSLALGVNIAHADPGVTSVNVHLVLPEPASLILLGSGLTILGLLGMRRARSKETDLLETSSRLM